MNYPGVWKECKFCNMRFGQDTVKCPKCGSSNARLVMPKEMEADRVFFAEEKRLKEKEQAEKQAKKKKSLRKWKKALCTIGIILAIILLLYIVGTFLIVKWASWMSQKEAEKVPEITETNKISGTNEDIREEELSDEQLQEKLLITLDKLYAEHADEEILEIFLEDIEADRFVYEWEHYSFAFSLWEFDWIESIWECERSGEILEDYQHTELLYYYLMYRDFESTDRYTTEEKERLEKYVTKLREDVEWRFNLTEEAWEALYADVTAGQGYVDYAKVKEYVENSDVWVASVIKATESMDDEAWKSKVFPILDELFEEGKDQELILIYYNTKHQHKSSRPFEVWEHGHYVAYVWEMMSMESLLQEVNDGKRLSELDYGTILDTYLRYVDYVDANIMTEEEIERFTPYFGRLEQCATSLWDFSKGEWKALLEKSKKEYVGVEVERLVHKWLQEMDREKQADEPEISE